MRVGGKIALKVTIGYNEAMSNWNPLYPSDEDVDPLEEAAREAEWEDDTRGMWRKNHNRNNEDDINDE